MNRLTRKQFLRMTGLTAIGAGLSVCLPQIANADSEGGLVTVKPTPPVEDVLAALDAKVEQYFNLYGNCAQASFKALKEQFGFADENVVKALVGFPGIGMLGETCGGVTGSMMALGMVFGSKKPGQGDGMSQSVQFVDEVVQQVGATRCFDILKAGTGQEIDLRTEDGWNKYFTYGGPAVCLAAVKKMVRLAALRILAAPTS